MEVTDFNENFVKRLKNNLKLLNHFVREIIEQYERGDDFRMFLEGVKAVATATEGMTKISKKPMSKGIHCIKLFLTR